MYKTLDFVAEHIVGTIRMLQADHWSSDWNGDEVGYPEIDVVGLYTMRGAPVAFYADASTGLVLEAWLDLDD